LNVGKNKEESQMAESSKELQEEEISLDETSSDGPDGVEDASLIFDENKEEAQTAESSGELQEEEISLDETFSDGPDGVEDASLIFDENKEEAQMTASLEELQIKEISTFETTFVSPDEQEGKPAETFPPKPDTAPIRPAKQARPNFPIPFSVRDAGQPKTAPDASTINKPSKKIIAVGGAKGGVGKSMLAANLAVGLAILGQKVVLADLDLGGAGVHLFTGIKSLSKTWNDFLDKKVDSIKDILTPTAFKGLSLIGGDSSKLGSANLPYLQKLKIMRHVKELETDYLVIDLGGDTTYNGLDFFLLADQKIVVSGTEPASILGSYTFVKVVFNRFLERFFSAHQSLKDLAEQIRDGSLEKSKNYSYEFIIQEVHTRSHQAAIQLKKQFDQFRLSIVLNMTESNKDVRIAKSMQKLVKDKCFLDIGILGTIPFDKVVCKAARGFTPIVVENPKCQASRKIHQMLAAIILHREQETARAELLHTTSRIRREAKKQIDSGYMTLDGLTVGQIDSVFNSTPRLRQSFQKILNILSS
jgi:flagellar biosynthesis protein FlhG